MTTGYRIVAVDAVECDLSTDVWSFAAAQAGTIERNWEARTRNNPHLFNGRVLVLQQGGIEAASDGRSVFRGRFIETDFKAFLAWRDGGFSATEVRNCFAMAALETPDGAFVLGEMAPHTAPAGQIYFPSGTPDLNDVVDASVDIDGSARRELREETGLDDGDVQFDPGFVLLMNDTRVCCMKRVRSAANAVDLVARVHAWLAKDAKSELVRMHIVRGPADIAPTVPGFVAAYLRFMFAHR